MFWNFEYANPGFLYLLLLVPLMAVWYWFRREKSTPTLQVSGPRYRKHPKRFAIIFMACSSTAVQHQC
jgi:hypothetical protein